MAKDKITEYDATAANNTDVGGVNLAENSMNPSDVNNAIREVMSHQKEAFGSGTPLFVDQTNNRVGVNNSSPTVALDVTGNVVVSKATPNVDIKDTGTAQASMDFLSNSDTVRASIGIERSAGGGLFVGSSAYSAVFGTASSGNTEFATNNNVRMVIDGSGNVGIGTTSPTKNLTIQGTASTLRLEDNTSGRYADIENSDGRMILRSDPDSVVASSRIVFEVDGTEGMRLESGKKFLVGATDVGVHVCRISGNSGGNAVLKVDNSATSGNTTCYLAFMDGSGSASVNSAFFQGFNGANNFYLLGNGTQTFTSDENAKKNIETTRDGYLEDLAKLRVVKYNWKEQEDGEDKELGLIAQEVEKVFPKLVMNDIDPQIEEKDKKKMLQTTVLPFMLLKALQEANTKITALETENKTQATQIADLINRVTALENAE